jgi:nucleotide-binding universal stress UspA family protein
MTDAPFVESVLHPSDFSESSRAAFAHALAIVLYRQADFTVFHVVPSGKAVDSWSDSPPVRKTMEQWGVLAPGSPRASVYEKLLVRVSKVNVRSGDPMKAVSEFVERKPTDLMVLATEGRTGLPRWLKPSVAEGIARRSNTMTLFVNQRTDGFISPDDGSILLKRILVPVDHTPSPVDAVNYAARAAVMSHEGEVEITLLRIGDEPDWPDLPTPEMETCKWHRMHRKGDVVDQIVEAAEETEADLIVMATAGAKGILGALRGSVTEQVLRRSPCCLLAVPAKPQ